MSGDFVDQWLDWLRQQAGETPAGGPIPWQAGLHNAMQQIADELAKQSDWRKALQKQTEMLLADLQRSLDQANTASSQLAGWLTGLAGDKGDGQMPDPAAMLGPFLCQWPALGLAACRDREWRQLRDALPQLQRAQADYGVCLLGMAEDALHTWHRQLLADDERPDAETLEQVWLTVLEEAWQRLLRDPQHQDCLRRLNMTTGQLREAGGALLEDLLQMFHLPTRRDLLALRQRLQQVRRQLPDSDLTEELSELRAEIRTLRDEVSGLQRQVAAQRS